MRLAFLLSGLCMCTTAPPPVGEIPQVPKDAQQTTSTATRTFAMRSLLLGELDRVTNVESTSAWKSYGYNLDGLTTTRTSSDVCATPISVNQIDGAGGIDNAFGSVILPIIQTGASLPRPSDNVTQRVKAGEWTLLIQVTGLSVDARQSAIGLSAQTFVGTNASNPTFDATTDWPVSPQSVLDGVSIASGASVRFSTVYVTNGILVARDANQPLPLPIQFTKSATLMLRIREPIITFEASTGLNGTIAGVLDVAEAVSAGRPFGEQLDQSLCGSAYDGIAQQVTQARDILVDGTNRSGVDCNAISIGVGFTANEVANPTTVGVDPPAPPNPCDAGQDASDAGTD